MEHKEKKRDYVLPASIVIAAVLISVSLVYNAGKKAEAPEGGGAAAAEDTIVPEPETSAVSMKPVSADDHILGSANAPVKIVVFTDLECPFCKRFHTTMHQAVQMYAGKVAWVYRHSPIDQLHPKARKEAEASECAAEQGGNEGFWEYVDRLMELTPSNNGLDPALLPKIATDVGLDAAKLTACLSSGKYSSKIEAQLQDALASGGGPTPYSIVIAKDGVTKYVLPGAFPLTPTQPGVPSVKEVLDKALE